MQSDTQLMPTRYLRNVLLDGAKPFLYRSGVRSLLGIPDSGGSEIAFSHAMPPVGFAYPNSHLMGEPYLPPYFPDLTVGSALGTQGIDLASNEEIVAKEAQQFQSESIAHSISQAKESGEAKVMPKGMAQTSAATPEPDQQNMVRPAPVSRQEKSLVETSEMPERSGAVFEPATIDIPGASKKIQNFPAVSLSEQRGEPFSNMAAEQFQPSFLPKDSRPSSVARLLSESSDIFAPSPLQVGNRDGVKKSDEASCQSSVAVLNSSPNTVDLNGIKPSQGEDWVRGNQNKDKSLFISPHQNFLPEGEVVPVTTFSTINGQPPSERVTQIDPGTGNGASRSADRIEQLRNAVHELAAKQSPPREQAHYEAQQAQQLPSPVQQVVIVRQPASPAGIPHAFWERSYLGRMRIRILR